MKKLLTLILVTMMLLTTVSAFAEAPQYSSTKYFTAKMDAEDEIYTVLGVDEEKGREYVTYEYKLDNGEEIEVLIVFNDSNENCAMYIWNLITYADQDFSKVLRTVNSLNSEYRFANFYADEEDNTINVSADAIFRSNDVGKICYELLERMLEIVNDEYATVAVYSK